MSPWGGYARAKKKRIAYGKSQGYETNRSVFISATVGTWASPFWTFFADSIWRQGGDTGYHGQGDTRQQALPTR